MRSSTYAPWVNRSVFRRLRGAVAANIARAHSLHERLVNQVQVFVKTELAIGMTQARIALRSSNPKEASRHTALGRQAYDTVIRSSQRMARTELQSEQFTAELDRLKVALRDLGERV